MDLVIGAFNHSTYYYRTVSLNCNYQTWAGCVKT